VRRENREKSRLRNVDGKWSGREHEEEKIHLLLLPTSADLV
jgi:hypothetical protein